MSRNKKNVYRHPITNKFISKDEWESLQKKEEEETTPELSGSDFDLDYAKSSEEFLKKIEESFNIEENNLVKTIPSHDKLDENKPVWKILFHRIAFWL
ncbi:MAG: hypothetical protein EBU90_25600 [Proteobacteria bacterium]|nr:hypothetical protein [Pseudomonadota bacterium]